MPITYESKEKILEREKREREQYLKNQSRNINKQTPPQIGQYAYFDAQIEPGLMQDPYIAVTNRGHFNCHYSSIQERHDIPFVTCQGIIQQLI